MVPRGLNSIFGREVKISYFRPKMDPEGKKSIFGQKNESSIFSIKICLEMVPRALKSILVEK